MTGWYVVSRRDVLERGGRGLFRYYGTLEKALRVAYPGYTWDSSEFKNANKTPSGFWNNKHNLLRALKDAEEKMHLKEVRSLSYVGGGGGGGGGKPF